MSMEIVLPITKRVISAISLMSVRDVMTARSEMSELLQVISKVQGRQPTAEEAGIIASKNNHQDEIIMEVLKKRCGLKDEDFDEMPYPDALYAYNRLFELTQDIPKN